MKYSSTLFSLGVAICSFLTAINSACAQTTAFIYNGKFVDGTNAVNGSYDLTFSLWDAVTNGTQQGNLLTNTDIIVSDGLFTATLDFGNQFPGADRWLEIGMRTNGGDTFTQLIPRQSMLPTPYAIYSANAGKADSAVTANSANSVSAANIIGTILLPSLPTVVLTNDASGVILSGTLSGTLSGNGAGIASVYLRNDNSDGAISWTTNNIYTTNHISYNGFVLAASLAVGSQPRSVVATDVNRDGKMDLICVNINSLSMLTNDGSGGFVLASSPSVSGGPNSVCVADVDGDGNPDLIVAVYGVGSGETLVVLKNDGSGGFVSNATLNVGSAPISACAEDINGDGKVDIICANYDIDRLTVLTNTGSGNFVLSSSPRVGSLPVSVISADINGDNSPDLISANSGTNTLTVLTNNGSGSFVFAFSPTVGINPNSVCAADINGDGKPDLISANFNTLATGTLTTLTNNGIGGFAINATLNVGSGPRSICAADVNGDGSADLICVNELASTANSLTILTNNARGGFVLATLMSGGTAPSSVFPTDVNGDGKVDLICATASVSLRVLTNATVIDVSTNLSFAANFTGNGSGLTDLNGSQISSGTIPLARLSGITSSQLNATTWQLATNLNGGNAALATNVVSGISITNAFITRAFITNSVFAGDGSGLTNLNVSQISNGIISLAQLPTVLITNGAENLTIGATNVIAPLTVPPKLPTSAFGSTAVGSPYFVTVAGNYAYVGDKRGTTMEIIDVSKPSAPIKVGLAGTGQGPICVAVNGRYAYVVNFYDNTLQVIDVGNPSSPSSVGLVPTGGFPAGVVVAGRYAYVVNNYDNTLQIFDVGNPSSPVLSGSVVTGNGPFSVAVAGRYAYVGNIEGNTMQVFDVGNASAPVSVGSVATGKGPVSVAVAGRYAYVVNAASNTLQIIDVKIPTAPVSVSSVSTGQGPVSVAVAGRYAYVVSAGTLAVFDVSNPSVPINIGSVSTGSGANTVAVVGRYAYVGNINDQTLKIFDMGGAYIQQFEAGTIQTGTMQTRDTATIGNNLDVRGGLTVSASARISGGLSVDNGTIRATNFIGNFTGSGSALTNLNASQISSGTLPLAALPSDILTNGASGVSLTGTFTGNGSNLISLNASNLTGGTVPLAALPSGVLTNGASGVTLSGTFNGNGTSLTNTTTAGNFVFAYATRMQPLVSVGVFQDITFGFNGQINGWIHTPGSGSFTNTQTGLYLVQYTAELSAKNQNEATISVRGTLNGTEIRGSQSSVLVMRDSLTTLAKSFLASANSGDVLSLQFTSTRGGVIAQNIGDGTTRPSVSCTIIRIQ